MNWLYAVQMVLGLGLVIFVHELGHFLAARWCGVRVRVFSLGFGPPLVSFVRGGVRYQIAAVPIGGFVSMAGEFAGENSDGPREGDLLSKSVGQRFFVYSAGVLMNLLFAIVVLPILFWVGVPFDRPVLGDPVFGGPAWEAGLTAGTEVLEVGGNRVFEFGQISSEVALSASGPLTMLVRPPGATEPQVVRVEPVQGSEGFREIQVSSGGSPTGALDPTPDEPAARAGILPGERLLGAVGQPSRLSLDRQLYRALEPGENLRLRIADADGVEREVELELEWKAAGPRALIGVASLGNKVAGLRGGGPLVDALPLGSRLERVRGIEITNHDDLIDALLEGDVGAPSTAVGPGGTVLDVTEALEDHVASRRDALAAAEDIALVPDRESTLVAPSPDGAALEAGVLPGDRVIEIGGTAVATWDELLEAVADAVRRGGEVEVAVERPAFDSTPYMNVERFVVTPRPAMVTETGLMYADAEFVFRTANPLEAITTGLTSTRSMLADVWIALQRIVTAEISSKNIGGVVSMAAIGYHTAKQGPSKLFYFLCLLSINLALINVLPIPVLDGGHLMFLLVEKIKGGPVSERVLGYSQLVGFVMIVSLVVYVTWNDIQRWIIG
ncbi:Regulator of sigma-W protease RasP [Planctomycetes bacterium Pla163]|uniref:Regulator of sigma-W protease RasP n=1 Tax=Rohdeia mirabilis TaxID=2528008 RepID=A0A518D0H0_9BACT|nr:Regulator of sigma-W protease RasP [Planctomycetes bacterium Pla163]